MNRPGFALPLQPQPAPPLATTITDPGPVMVNQPLSGNTFMLLISGVISEEEAKAQVKARAKAISPVLPAVLP